MIEDYTPFGEFKLGIGFFTYQELAIASGTEFTVDAPLVVSGGDDNPSINERSAGTYFVGYSGYLSDEWSLGVQVFYGEYEVDNTYSNGNMFGYTNRYIGSMLRTDFRWINKPTLQLYSGVGVGIASVVSQSFDGANANKITYAFQATPIGVRYGDGFGIFAEAGYGNTGIVVLGINYRL